MAELPGVGASLSEAHLRAVGVVGHMITLSQLGIRVCFRSQSVFGRSLFQGPITSSALLFLYNYLETELWFVRVFWAEEKYLLGFPTVEKWHSCLLISVAQVRVVAYLSSLLLYMLLLSPANFMHPNPQEYNGLHHWRPGAQCLINRGLWDKRKISYPCIFSVPRTSAEVIQLFK